MEKIYLPVILVLIIIVVVFLVFSILWNHSNLSLNDVFSQCKISNNEIYKICCREDGKVADCTSKTTFSCGEPITAIFNITKINLNVNKPTVYSCFEYPRLSAPRGAIG